MHQYRLGQVPKALRRRVNLLATVTLLALGAAVMTGVFALEGARVTGRTWLVLVVISIVVGGGLVAATRSLSEEDRELLARAQCRVLEPLPRPHGTAADPLRIELQPGPIWRRRLAGRPDAHWLVATEDGLSVPGWLLEMPPRVVSRSDPLLIEWQHVERFRVRAESDGADIYDIACERSPHHSARWRVRRHEITDEIALLDYARSVGGITVELEASLDPT